MSGVELDGKVICELSTCAACGDSHAAPTMGTELDRSLNEVVRAWTHVSEPYPIVSLVVMVLPSRRAGQ